MGEQDNLQAIHKVYDAFGHGDVEGVISMLTDDVTWTTPGPPDVIPYAGERRGHDEVTGYFEAFGASTETTAFEPQKFFADGDMVVVLGHYTFNVAARARSSTTTSSTPSSLRKARSRPSRATRTAPPWSRPSPPGRTRAGRWVPGCRISSF